MEARCLKNETFVKLLFTSEQSHTLSIQRWRKKLVEKNITTTQINQTLFQFSNKLTNWHNYDETLSQREHSKRIFTSDGVTGVEVSPFGLLRVWPFLPDFFIRLVDEPFKFFLFIWNVKKNFKNIHFWMIWLNQRRQYRHSRIKWILVLYLSDFW